MVRNYAAMQQVMQYMAGQVRRLCGLYLICANAPHALEVFWSIDPRWRVALRDVDGNRVPIFQRTQLLQRFPPFQRPLRQAAEASQKAGPIGIKADVVQGVQVLRQGVGAIGEGVSWPRNRCT